MFYMRCDKCIYFRHNDSCYQLNMLPAWATIDRLMWLSSFPSFSSFHSIPFHSIHSSVINLKLVLILPFFHWIKNSRAFKTILRNAFHNNYKYCYHYENNGYEGKCSTFQIVMLISRPNHWTSAENFSPKSCGSNWQFLIGIWIDFELIFESIVANHNRLWTCWSGLRIYQSVIISCGQFILHYKKRSSYWTRTGWNGIGSNDNAECCSSPVGWLWIQRVRIDNGSISIPWPNRCITVSTRWMAHETFHRQLLQREKNAAATMPTQCQ